MMKVTNALILFILSLCASMPSLAVKPVGSKQQRFIKQIVTDVEAVNHDVLADRERLVALHKKHQKGTKLSTSEQAWLNQLAARYHYSSAHYEQESTWKAMLERVDLIPPSLAVAQAATESGWGRSRFAKLANNYFGESCFRRGCGVAPARKPRGVYFEARRFSSPKQAVQSYVYNLNSHRAYQSMRQLRAKQRAAHRNPDGLVLVHGLRAYSERGPAYIQMISKMIKRYHLEQYDKKLSDVV